MDFIIHSLERRIEQQANNVDQFCALKEDFHTISLDQINCILLMKIKELNIRQSKESNEIN